MKELDDVKLDVKSGVTITPVNESHMLKLIGSFNGPPDTPYEGGIFKVNIEVPHEYPYTPPKMKFLTKIFHPNISSQTGAICLDILKDKWTPVYTLKSCLISLQALLQSPEPDNPQDAVVAKVYKDDKAEFDKTAAEWTKKYAQDASNGVNGNSGIDEAVIALFVNMGFTKDKVIKTLLHLEVKSLDKLKVEGTEDKVILELCK